MSYHGLDHWITTDPEDWAENEEREEVTRAMGRMSDEETEEERIRREAREELRREAREADYEYEEWWHQPARRHAPPEIDDSTPF